MVNSRQEHSQHIMYTWNSPKKGKLVGSVKRNNREKELKYIMNMYKPAKIQLISLYNQYILIKVEKRMVEKLGEKRILAIICSPRKEFNVLYGNILVRQAENWENKSGKDIWGKYLFFFCWGGLYIGFFLFKLASAKKFDQ